MARFAPAIVGSPTTFLVLLAATALWLVLGPVVGFSNGWLLVPSALASVVALLLVVLLQQSQNRDTRALQLKLGDGIELTRQRDIAGRIKPAAKGWGWAGPAQETTAADRSERSRQNERWEGSGHRS